LGLALRTRCEELYLPMAADEEVRWSQCLGSLVDATRGGTRAQEELAGGMAWHACMDGREGGRDTACMDVVGWPSMWHLETTLFSPLCLKVECAKTNTPSKTNTMHPNCQHSTTLNCTRRCRSVWAHGVMVLIRCH
jgi:hypothetical protein